MQAYGDSKFDAFAEGFTARTYADPARYFGRRLELFVEMGPRLRPDARVLELGCGDGTFAELLVARGFEYVGVDLSRGMVEVTQRRLGDRGVVVQADLNTFVPDAHVDAVVSLNASYYATDRVAFFSLVRSYACTKFFLDFIAREQSQTPEQLRAAGWANLALRPFFVPESYVLPAPARALLEALERVGPVARALLRRRFSYLVAAWP